MIDARSFPRSRVSRRNDRPFANCADGSERCDADVSIVRGGVLRLAGVEQIGPGDVVAVDREINKATVNATSVAHLTEDGVQVP